jgi:thiol-disulfide isomerase/thioredoxin
MDIESSVWYHMGSHWKGWTMAAVNNGRDRLLITVALAAVVLGAVMVAWMISGDGTTPQQADVAAGSKPLPPATPVPSSPPVPPAPQAPSAPAATKIPQVVKVKATLAQIAAGARTWEPQLMDYFGKQMPDLVARDLDGKEVKVSGYKGRNVLLFFWATWCAPCRAEIPGFIELRKKTPEDKLAIIAVSTDRLSNDPIINNSMHDKLVVALRDFAQSSGVNYTVVTVPSHVERPYSLAQALPSAFFIDPNGILKFATAGLVPLKDTEAILAAEK